MLKRAKDHRKRSSLRWLNGTQYVDYIDATTSAWRWTTIEKSEDSIGAVS